MRRVLGPLLLAGCAEVVPDLPVAPDVFVDPPALCPGHDVEIHLEGQVHDALGVPVAEIPLWTWDLVAGDWKLSGRSGPDGRYAFSQPGPSWVAVRPWRSEPAMECRGVPVDFPLPDPSQQRFKMIMEDVDFVVPQMCRWHFELPGADGPVELTLWRPDTVFSLSTVAIDGVASPKLPCDLTAVAMAGDGVASAADPNCAVSARATCITESHTLTLTPVASTRLVVHARDAAGQPLAATVITDGAFVARTNGDGEASVHVRADADVVARHADHLHAQLALGAGFTVRSDRETDADGAVVWDLALPAARELTLVCDDAIGPCPVVPRCRAPGAPAVEDGACWRADDTQVRCQCPMGDAVLVAPGLEVPVPAAVTDRVPLPLDGFPGRITGHAGGDCVVRATPMPGWWARLTGATPPQPRMARCDADGGFALPALSEGTWRLTVHADARTADVEAERVVAVGEGSVDVGTLSRNAPPAP
ncbi:MAG: hypothetical protein H6733_10645 [Alphaproteobacteria bacterium]|nr:hypothetical protein [Alphaproteobacteria bacterium]